MKCHQSCLSPFKENHLTMYAQSNSKTFNIENTVFFEKIDKEAQRPHKAYQHSAGDDLTINENLNLEPGDSHDAKLGQKIYIPRNKCGLILPRSSNGDLRIEPRVIDSGYTGIFFYFLFLFF